MSWSISNDGHIQCLDDGPIVPWWIDPEDVESIDRRTRTAVLRPYGSRCERPDEGA